jgi:hypothetical protein
VRVAGLDLPLWLLLAPTVLIVVGLAAAVAALISPGTATAPELAATSASVAASSKPAPSALPPRSLAGLEGKDPATLEAEDLLALAEKHAERELEAAHALRERIEKEPKLLGDRAVLNELRRYTEDPETARETLAALASADDPRAPDLLYEIWTGTQARTEATELARALLHAKDVRGKASPALAVALDLRGAETCEQSRALLPRALKDGDKRSHVLLNRLERKQGCGKNKREDCFACLRQNEELEAAIEATKTRAAANPFKP